MGFLRFSLKILVLWFVLLLFVNLVPHGPQNYQKSPNCFLYVTLNLNGKHVPPSSIVILVNPQKAVKRNILGCQLTYC